MSEEPKDIFAILSEIKTIDDLKENEKLILETATSEFEAGLKTVEALAASSEPPQIAMTKFNQIRTDQQALSSDMDEHFNRIRQIPGADDIIMSIKGELVGRYGAITSKMSMLLPEIMSGGPPSSASGPPPQSGGMDGPASKRKYKRMIFTGYTSYEGEFEVLEILRSVHSETSFEAKRDEILDQMHEHYTNELSKATELKSKDQASEETQTEIKEFTNRFLYFSAEVGNEFNRLEAVLGTAKPIIGLSDELAKNTMSTSEEVMKILEELGADKMDEFNKLPEIETVTLGEERVKLDELAEIYKVKSVEELQQIKDNFYKTIQSSMENDLQVLKDIKSGNYPQDDAASKIEEIDRHMQQIGNEMDQELDRIGRFPGGHEGVEAFREESMKGLGPLAEEIMKLLDEL
jgi:hypothetical protein